MSSSQTSGSRQVADIAYYLIASVVGLITGLIGTAFHLIVNGMLVWPSLVGEGLPLWLRLLCLGLVAAAMVVSSVWLVRTFAPEAGGSGVQEIEGAMENLREVRWKRVLPVKFFGGILALGSGLVVGREGPTIHMGASISQAAANAFGLDNRDMRGLLAAGAAAGLAAAFNAPLAAILFVIEETRRQFPYGIRTYTGVILASVISGIVTQQIAGVRPFMLIELPQVPASFLPAFVVLGLILGVMGVVFNTTLLWSLEVTRKFALKTSPYVFPAVVGFAIGVLLLLLPEATQGGEQLAVRLTTEHLSLSVLAGIVLIRFAMTMASYSTGVPGGIFAPLLATAASIGILFGTGLGTVMDLPAGAVAALAVAAMGGLFSSTVRAPLVGIVLVAELTAAYDVLIPVMLTCIFSHMVAAAMGGQPIYEQLLNRTLRLAGKTPPPAEPEEMGGWDTPQRKS